MDITPQSWHTYVDLLKECEALEAQLWVPEDEQQRAALYRQLAMNLAQGYFLYFQSTPAHPDWMPFENSVFLAQPNPDAVYYYAPVDGIGTYRVTGNRGTSPVVGFATGKILIGMGNPPGPGYNNYDLDSLALEANGDFDILFSASKPDGYNGLWLYLNPEAKFLLLRQFSYDWGNETDVRIAIERVDSAPIKPPMTPTETDNSLKQLFGGYTQRLSQLCLGVMAKNRAEFAVNTFRLVNFEDLGNSSDWPQAYFEALYDIAEDEALIIETALPKEHVYWNLQVIDPLWNQVELLYAQSSLNGHQAQVDSDGKFRAVLSLQDPGVPNWLDTHGNLKGLLIGRWYRCSDHPIPKLTKIKLSEVRDVLPDDTPTMDDSERRESLRLRRQGAQLRRRW